MSDSRAPDMPWDGGEAMRGGGTGVDTSPLRQAKRLDLPGPPPVCRSDRHSLDLGHLYGYVKKMSPSLPESRLVGDASGGVDVPYAR